MLEQERVDGQERESLQATLRTLYVVAGRLDNALEPIEDADDARQRYWSEQFYGLHVLLDNQGTPVTSRRSVLALRHLRTMRSTIWRPEAHWTFATSRSALALTASAA